MSPSSEQTCLQALLDQLAGLIGGEGETASILQKLRDGIAALQAQLERRTGYLQSEISSELRYKKLIGNAPAMRQVRQAIAQVAPTDSTVLIAGETGTGKELIARAIHEQSPRRRQLLVKVNCAALPPSLVASELFGHEAEIGR